MYNFVKKNLKVRPKKTQTSISVCLMRNFVLFKSLQDAVKIMAKDLVRTRRYVKKFIMMKANIQAVSLKIQTLKSNNSMAQAMKGVTKAMATMNRQVCASQSLRQTVMATSATFLC